MVPLSQNRSIFMYLYFQNEKFKALKSLQKESSIVTSESIMFEALFPRSEIVALT